MKKTTQKLLAYISEWINKPEGAYNIRENGMCVDTQNSKHVQIKPKKDGSGIDIHISAQAQGEKIYIPACITKSNVEDLVYNDFFIEDGANITIIAGCGIHTDGSGSSHHNGIHRFFVGKGAHVLYLEKHIGIGEGTGKRIINPKTLIELAKNSYMKIDTTQIEGVDSTQRETQAKLAESSKLIIREKIMTHDAQTAFTDFEVVLDGENSGADLISRSVAKGSSKQLFRSRIYGDAACNGHSECDAIIMDSAEVSAIPELTARNVDAALIHEAAIGKIAGEQIIKLMTLGLTEEQAEAKIIEGFLK